MRKGTEPSPNTTAAGSRQARKGHEIHEAIHHHSKTEPYHQETIILLSSGKSKSEQKRRILELEYHPRVVGAVVQLVWRCGVGRAARGTRGGVWELHGQVRVVSARKNAEEN